jgi:cytochrome c oxidase subunit III
MADTLHPPVGSANVEVPDVDEYAPPAGATELGVWIGVIAIGVMFAAGCVGYWMVRQHATMRVDVPLIFWASTAAINVSSVVLYYAMLSARATHRLATRRAMDITALLAVAFLILQVPGLREILAAHHAAIEQGHGVYAVMLILISLHAAHVVVGLGAIAVLTRRVHRYRLANHENTIHLLGIYWHGLTVIWLVLFSLLIVAK